MVVDSSALVAILLAEPDRGQFLHAIEAAATCRLSLVNALETAIVVEARRGPAAASELDAFLSVARIELVPVDHSQLQIARQAWRRFGKGRSSAKLNFGDCFAYALARWMQEPLLAKGPEFGRTDLHLA